MSHGHGKYEQEFHYSISQLFKNIQNLTKRTQHFHCYFFIMTFKRTNLQKCNFFFLTCNLQRRFLNNFILPHFRTEFFLLLLLFQIKSEGPSIMSVLNMASNLMNKSVKIILFLFSYFFSLILFFWLPLLVLS